MKTSTSLIWTGAWVGAALSFAVYIFNLYGMVGTMQYLTIFTLEKMLSMDNLLVMYLIFKYFDIPEEKRHRALMYGLVGAFFFRTVLIYSGTFIVAKLTWLLYLFAAFLIYAGAKMLSDDDGDYDPADSKIVELASRFTGGSFVACIIAIELSDIMFAVDSIPASFGVSQDPFIIITANLFAVMGLRSLYHAVANGIELLHGIEKYIGVVLALVGVSVFVNHLWFHIPETHLLTAVFGILGFGVFKCKGKSNEELAQTTTH